MYQRQPFPELPWRSYLFTYFFAKFNQPFTRGPRQLQWASCFTLAGRVTLAGRTTFLDINTLACLTKAIPSIASVTNLGFKAEICIKEVKINSAKVTLIKWLRKTQRREKRDICTFDCSTKVMNDHPGSTLTRTTGTTFSHITLDKVASEGELSWVPQTI